MKKIIRKVASFSLIFGILLFIGACSLREDVTYNENEFTVDAIKINEIFLKDEGKRITVKKSKDKKIHLTYIENSKLSYQISVSDDGRLNIVSTEKKDWKDYVGLKDRGTLFVELSVPKEAMTNLQIDSKNGKVELLDFDIDGGLNVTTDGGKIDGDGINAAKSINLKTKKAPISVLNPKTKGDVTVETEEGNIDLVGMKYGKSLDLKTEKGNVSASIVGKSDDFTIKSKVLDGNSNVPEVKKGGKKKVNVDVKRGNVEIKFEEESKKEKK